MFCFACSVSSPNDGAEDGKPKPKKSKAAKLAIVPVTINGSIVRVATIAFGSMCLNIIFKFETPNAFAARTYSKFLARKNSALTTPTNPIQPNRTDKNTSNQKLRPRIANIIMIIYSDGTPDQISMNL